MLENKLKNGLEKCNNKFIKRILTITRVNMSQQMHDFIECNLEQLT